MNLLRTIKFFHQQEIFNTLKRSKTSLKILVLLGFLLFLYSGGNLAQTEVKKTEPSKSKILTLVKVKDLPAPQLTATAAAVFDITSKTFLYEKNADLKMPPASTTKIMTAIVVLDKCQPTQIASVSAVLKNNYESQMGLVSGERISVENLLYGLMLPSGNDAAVTLAQTCSKSVEQFISSMNKRAQELGMGNTHFQNTTGLDEAGHYSTARDLTKQAVRLLEIPTLAKIVQTPKKIVSDESGVYLHSLENKNKLLGKIPGVLGIKTGTTQAAREALVSAIERDEHKIIIVILGSQDRFTETEELINWTFESYEWALR